MFALLDSSPDADVIAGTTRPPAPIRPGPVERFNRAFAYYPRPLFSNGELYCLPTANVAIRRTVFLEAMGFDVNFCYAAGEDLNFFYRLQRRGVQFHLDENWYVTHPVNDTLRSFAQRWYRYGYGTAQHRIRSDDERDYGLEADISAIKLLCSIPKHLRVMRGELRRKGKSCAGRVVWEPVLYDFLATIRHVSYLRGGRRAFSTERKRSRNARSQAFAQPEGTSL